MPRFVLVPASGLSMDADLASNAANVSVLLSLRDPLLNITTPVTVMASVQARSGNRHTVTLRGTFIPPVPIWNGLFTLDDLTITLRYAAPVGAGDPPLENNGITAEGIVKWANAASLGFAVAPTFRISYNSGANRFALTLINAVPVPGGLAEITTALLAAELPLSRPVLIVTVAGQASLTQDGSTNATQLLRQAFGSNPPINPAGFFIRQEFSLAGGRPTIIQPPSFDFSLNPANFPALPGLPNGLAISIGTPILRLPLATQRGANWTLRLHDCRITFPQIRALSGVNLIGNLEWRTSGSRRTLLFEPTLPGAIELPDIARFLFSRLAWLGSQIPLQEVLDNARLTPEELDWQSLFASLLPDPLPANIDLNNLRLALKDLIEAALETQIGRERVFLIAFQALARGGQSVLTVVWDVWFEITDHNAMPAFFRGLLALPQSLFSSIVAALARCAAFQPAQFIDALVSTSLTTLAARFNDFLTLLIRSLSILIRDLNAGARIQLANALRSALLRLADTPRPANFRLASDIGIRFDAFNVDVNHSPAEFTLLASVLGLAAASPSFLQPMSSSSLFSGSLPRLWSAIVAPFLPLIEGVEIEANRLVGFFGELFRPDVGWSAQQRRRYEELMMMIATYPIVGQLFTLVVLLVIAIPNAVLFGIHLVDLLIKPINTQSGRKVLTLPGGKYIIFSDIHRDVRADDLGPLQFGSIDHFSTNKRFYLQLLNWALQNDYTVIEAGDCEELWYIRSAASHEAENRQGKGFPRKMREIISTHQAVYDKLRELHHKGRYYRVYGNHDSYLHDDDIFSILKTEMEKPVGTQPVKPFEIYEYIILSEVKEMLEHSALDLLGGLWPLNKTAAQKQNLVRDLIKGRLGMDSTDYEKLCPMLIAHGHQFDYWNSDATNLAGKLISNAAGVPADWLLDPIIDLRGIAMGGSPACDFVDLAATLPVWNNWPGETAAVKFAHKVQHTPNKERKLSDDIFYSETFATILGTTFMSINYKEGQNPEVTPPQTAVNVDNLNEVWNYLQRHHNHHLCLGHTHNPQSQPYFSSSKFPLLGNVLDFFIDLINLLKSRYLNSGTAGWMEGVIWGIQVADDRQARLVYWTQQSKSMEPQLMDWELTKLDPTVKSAINHTIDGVSEYFRNVGEKLGVVITDLQELLAKQISLPFNAVVALLMRAGVSNNAGLSTLSEARAGESGVRDWVDNVEKLQLRLISFLIQYRGRILRRSTAAPQSFTIELPLDLNARATLNQLARWFDSAANPGAPALAGAALAYSLLQGFPRNFPTIGRTQRMLGFPPVLEAPNPVLNSLCAMLPLLPVFGQPMVCANQQLSGRVEITAQPALKVTLTMGAI